MNLRTKPAPMRARAADARRRSVKAAERLIEAGSVEVGIVRGGMEPWSDQGRAIAGGPNLRHAESATP